MSTPKDLSFFVLSSDIGRESGIAVVNVDHKLVSSISLEMHSLLNPVEIEFVLWYQNKIYEGLMPPVQFVVDPSCIDSYDQVKVCRQILDYLNSPTVDDTDLF